MTSLILFCGLQFINVVLGTLRSICTVKAGLHIGMLVNVASYTFYAAVVKLLTEQDLYIVIAVTAVTNCIGFYLAQFLFKKMQKDKLWRITATVSHEKELSICKMLEKYNISYNVQATEGNKTSIFDIFSKTQGESTLIKEILVENSAKYHVLEIEKSL